MVYRPRLGGKLLIGSPFLGNSQKSTEQQIEWPTTSIFGSAKTLANFVSHFCDFLLTLDFVSEKIQSDSQLRSKNIS